MSDIIDRPKYYQVATVVARGRLPTAPGTGTVPTTGARLLARLLLVVVVEVPLPGTSTRLANVVVGVVVY